MYSGGFVMKGNSAPEVNDHRQIHRRYHGAQRTYMWKELTQVSITCVPPLSIDCTPYHVVIRASALTTLPARK